MHGRLQVLATLLVVGLLSRPAIAENWPQFRGPGGSGLASEKGIPCDWGESSHVAWKIELPGFGWSQPIVWGDKIFLTTAETDKEEKPRVGEMGPGGGPPRFDGEGPRRFGPNGGPPRFEGERPRRFGSGDGPPGDRRRPERESGFQRETRPERGAPPDRDAVADRGGPPFGAESRRPPRGGFPFGSSGGTPPDVVYRWKVLCLDGSTGKVLWEQTAHEGKPKIPKNRSNSYASETPVTDGQRLVAYFGMTGVYCYDLSGQLLWKKDLGAFPMQMDWGTGSSPALDGDRVFIQCDNDQESFLVALDARTGNELWRVARDEKSNWSTPYVWKNRQRTELVTAGGTKVRSYQPETGALLWEMVAYGRSSLTPVGDEEMIYVDSVDRGMGGIGALTAIRAGGSGDISPPENETTGPFVPWSVSLNTFRIASPLLYEGRLCMLDQQSGIIRCYNAKTGDEHFRGRLPETRGFTASPWANQGKIFCLDQNGVTVVIEAGPQLKVVATNKLDQMFWSSAAVAGERLLLRGVDHLYCITK